MTHRYQKFISSFDTLSSLLGFYCFAGLVPFFFRESRMVIVVLCLLIACCALMVTVQLMKRFGAVREDQSMSAQQLLQLLNRLGFVRFRFNILLMLLLSGLHLAGWKFYHSIPLVMPLASGILFLSLTVAEFSFYMHQIRLKVRVKMNKARGAAMLDGGQILFPQSALATANS